MAGLREAGQSVMPGSDRAARLTARQAEVLQLAATGLSGKQIARQLGISPRTVEDHFSAMRQRTGARSDCELVAYGVAAGIVIPAPAPPADGQAPGQPAAEPDPQLGAGKRSVLNTSRTPGPLGRRPRSGVPATPREGVQKTCCRAGVSSNSGSALSPTLPGMAPLPGDSPGAADPRPVAGDLPAAEPAVLTGALIGYARVSTRDQLLDRQITALEAAGCIRIFSDKKSGKTAGREELRKALDYLRPGDTLVVPSLDRLGRSLQDLLAIIVGLRKRGIGFRSLKEALDTTTPGGRLVFHVFAALAEFIRELIIEGTHEGLAAARARGQRLGRPPAMTPEQIRHARALLTQPDATIASIARLLKVSRSTIYKYVPELKTSDRHAVEAPVPHAELESPR
jgi:DNA invertase Pin-like site-specific DNA recombinase